MASADKRDVGRRVREAREAAGFKNQPEFAKAISLSVRQLSRIESGESSPRGSTRQRIAEVTGQPSERFRVARQDADALLAETLREIAETQRAATELLETVRPLLEAQRAVVAELQADLARLEAVVAALERRVADG